MANGNIANGNTSKDQSSRGRRFRPTGMLFEPSINPFDSDSDGPSSADLHMLQLVTLTSRVDGVCTNRRVAGGILNGQPWSLRRECFIHRLLDW
jgi:hypothetical protein